MIGMPGTLEMIIIGIVAVLLFGSRLPKIARSVGSSIIEFKKGVRGIEDVGKEVNNEVRESLEQAPQ